MLGGDPNENAQITRAVLQGGQKGPKRDVVLLNTGAALHLAHPALSIQAGIELAAKTIDSGAALAELNKLIEFSRQNQSSQDVIA